MDGYSFEVCRICMTYMIDPRILPCSHSFCLKCLESSIILTKSSKCPTCQMDFEIPQGGLEDLKKNAFIEQLNILKQNTIKCDSCKENQAVKFCVECSYNYCSTCLEHHARIPIARNHQLQSATKTDISINKYSIFDKHSELMTLVCKNCRINTENLKMKEETLLNIIKNLKSSKDMICENELKASTLKKEIQQRGSDAKKIIDSIVVSINKNIDEEVKQQRQKANDVLVKLKNMEDDLREQIQTLRHQMENLSCANVVEVRGNNTVEQSDAVPIYCKQFNPSFHFDADLCKLEKLFKNPQKAAQVRLVKEETIKSNIESFALFKGNFYGLERLANASFEIFEHSENSEKKSIVKFDKKLFGVGNLLVIDGKFFVSGVSEKGHHYILNVFKNVDNWELIRFFEHPPLKSEKNMPRMSKSICGNILVNIFNKIFLFSKKGAVMKRINLSFFIQDVLQLDKATYVVCSGDEVRIIDDKGNILVKHSYHSRKKKEKSPSSLRLAKDNHGSIYVYDFTANKVLVLDRCLRIKLSFAVKCRLREIVYDEVRNALVISCEDGSFLTYAL